MIKHELQVQGLMYDVLLVMNLMYDTMRLIVCQRYFGVPKRQSGRRNSVQGREIQLPRLLA